MAEVVDKHILEIDVLCEGFQRIRDRRENKDEYAVYDTVAVEKAEFLRCVVG